MKTRRPLYVLLIILNLLMTMAVAPAAVDAEEGLALEALLLDRINAARENPAAAADQVFIDAAALFMDNPRWTETLEKGLPPLKISRHLSETARDHVEDMLSENYFGKTSADGRLVDDRIKEGNYWPSMVGESLGIVAFRNFMDAGTALGILFENMLKEALDADAAGPGNLFSPDFTDIGIALGTGVMAVGGTPSNVYLLVCDFARIDGIARATVGKIERNLITLINQLRSDPMAIGFSLGIDMQAMVADTPELLPLLSSSLPPLVPSTTLEAVAVGQTKNSLAGQSTGSFLVNDVYGAAARLYEAGYRPELTTGFVDAQALAGLADPAEAAIVLLNRMVVEELVRYNNDGRLHLFNADVREVGVGIETGLLKLSGEVTDTIVSTVIVGTTAAQKPAYLVHTVWRDTDSDGLCGLEEGIGAATITLETADHLDENAALIQQTYSNDAGMGIAMVVPGVYRIVSVLPGGAKRSFGMVVAGENIGLYHRLE